MSFAWNIDISSRPPDAAFKIMLSVPDQTLLRALYLSWRKGVRQSSLELMKELAPGIIGVHRG